jgi:hypothetical protein
MNTTETITMPMRELDRFRVIQAVARRRASSSPGEPPSDCM